MTELTPRSLGLLNACFGDAEQRVTIEARLRREVPCEYPVLGERIAFSIVRYIFEHHDRDYVDFAFHLATRDWRDILMVAGHGESLEAHTVWADRTIREQPRVRITRPDALPLHVDASGWAECPKCGFRFRVAATDLWFGDRHRRCLQPLEIV